MKTRRCFLGLVTTSLLLATAPPALAAERPGLVLLLTVDQLRRDRLDATLPGGLGRLLREGRVYRDAMLAHAISETCPGHVVVATGRHPGKAGIPGNYFIDPETQARTYCVEDRTTQGRLVGREPTDEGAGRSPRNVRVDTIGDWLKAATPESRVFSVSGKDRSAIAMGGKRPNGVYWYVKTPPVGFTTSRYYAEALPDWLVEWNGSDALSDGILSKLPALWHHEPAAAVAAVRPDDYEGETTEFERTSGHPLRKGSDEEDVATQVYTSPFLDDLTIDLATRLLVREKLGQGSATDLLAVSLSATDLVGHAYGPRSHEASDALLRLDAGLGRLIGLAEQKVGKGRVLVALTADHGVLELPEWLEESGRRTCVSDDMRAGVVSLFLGLGWHLHKEIGPFFSIPKQWVEFAGGQLAVRRSLAEESAVAVPDVAAAVGAYLESYDEIARVWTIAEIQQGTSETAALYRNSIDPERSGDLVIEVAPTCLIHYSDEGTSHGSPHAYDREIPLVFYGPGVEAGEVAGPAASVDISTTLAALLGLTTPDDVDGRVLLGGAEAASPNGAGQR